MGSDPLTNGVPRPARVQMLIHVDPLLLEQVQAAIRAAGGRVRATTILMPETDPERLR